MCTHVDDIPKSLFHILRRRIDEALQPSGGTPCIQGVTHGVKRHQRHPEPDFLNTIKSMLKLQAELTRRSDLRNEIAKNLLSLGPVCLKKIVSYRTPVPYHRAIDIVTVVIVVVVAIVIVVISSIIVVGVMIVKIDVSAIIVTTIIIVKRIMSAYPLSYPCYSSRSKQYHTI